MLFLDASAITAIIAREPAADRLLEKLEHGGPASTSPLAVYEAVLAMVRINSIPVGQAKHDVLSFLSKAEVSIDAISAHDAEIALAAFEQFGKPHHKAKLNMGDCFAYAATMSRKAELLFVGNDFNQTDVPQALSRN
jgi:ribonuclease VapC